MIVYLDTSTVLQALVGRGARWPEWGRWRHAYTSELMGVEARRALDRLRLEQALDALHLASALLFEERRQKGLVFATHDRRQGLAGRALGLQVVGVP